MKDYTYRVTMVVTVTAPDLTDAEDLLSDYFGPGPECEDINVVSVSTEPVDD